MFQDSNFFLSLYSKQKSPQQVEILPTFLPICFACFRI